MKEIFSRRSVRKYKNEQVPYDLVETIVKAGMAAPSAGNERTWHFIIINDKNLLINITKVHPHANMLKESPVAIVVCSDLSLQKYKDFWVQDCSAATENMLLEATHLGLGSVWLGVYPVEERVKNIQNILKLPQNVIPLSIVSLGYPIETPAYVDDRYDPTRIHHNIW